MSDTEAQERKAIQRACDRAYRAMVKPLERLKTQALRTAAFEELSRMVQQKVTNLHVLGADRPTWSKPTWSIREY